MLGDFDQIDLLLVVANVVLIMDPGPHCSLLAIHGQVRVICNLILRQAFSLLVLIETVDCKIGTSGEVDHALFTLVILPVALALHPFSI